MSSLYTSLVNTASALSVFERALTVVQNNVSNVDTPGYAKLRQTINALPFNPEAGLSGGIAAGEIVSSRDEYAEEAVRRQQTLYGQADQTASDLVRVEPFFDATGNSGVPAALSQFFQAVSAWSVSPNDTATRQEVLSRAGLLAQAVNETAQGLQGAGTTVDQEIHATVDQINTLAGRLRDLNEARMGDFQSAANSTVDAQVHTTLEQLSQLVDITTLQEDDGSYTVLLGGQVPLVIGDQQYQIQADGSDPNNVRILSPQSASPGAIPITGGRLGALLEMKDQTIPSFMSNLNGLAKALADNTNAILAGGVDVTGQPGAPLFTYNAPDGSDAALTLKTTAITAGQLAAALPEAAGGNGNTLKLAALASQPIAELGNFTLTDSYASLATRVGQAVSRATDDRQMQDQLLIQAQTLRSDISGVSLDEEAANLIEFQRAYQATSQLFKVLNDLTQTTLDLLP